MKEEIIVLGRALEKVCQEITEAFQTLFNAAEDKWEEIKEFIEEHQGKVYERDYIRDSWIVPARIHLMNQVIIRKPIMCRARGNC